MRALELSNDNREAVDNLVKFAEDEDNWYRIGKSDWVPGDRPEYCLHLNNFRTVYTNTMDIHSKLYRHLSISVPAEDKFPNEIVTYTIATWFGFTGAKIDKGVSIGPGKTWMLDINKNEGCIVVGQRIEYEKESKNAE